MPERFPWIKLVACLDFVRVHRCSKKTAQKIFRGVQVKFRLFGLGDFIRFPASCETWWVRRIQVWKIGAKCRTLSVTTRSKSEPEMTAMLSPNITNINKQCHPSTVQNLQVIWHVAGDVCSPERRQRYRWLQMHSWEVCLWNLGTSSPDYWLLTLFASFWFILNLNLCISLLYLLRYIVLKLAHWIEWSWAKLTQAPDSDTVTAHTPYHKSTGHLHEHSAGCLQIHNAS